jgi:hypothetical protein
MYKTLIALLFVAFAFSACDSDPKSQVSSTKAARLLDQDMAYEIQKQREESMRELNNFDSRFVEALMLINETYTSECTSLNEKYAELMMAQAEFFQNKTHYEMERNMLIDKITNIVATANSKDEVKEQIAKVLEDVKHQSEIYLNSGRNLLGAMRNAKIESPLIDEMLAPAMNEEGDGSAPEGEPVIEGEVH